MNAPHKSDQANKAKLRLRYEALFQVLRLSGAVMGSLGLISAILSLVGRKGFAFRFGYVWQTMDTDLVVGIGLVLVGVGLFVCGVVGLNSKARAWVRQHLLLSILIALCLIVLPWIFIDALDNAVGIESGPQLTDEQQAEIDQSVRDSIRADFNR